MSKERLSHGKAVNRRRILAETRQNAVLDTDKHIIEKEQARKRLMEIDHLLLPDNQTLSMMNKQELEQTQTGLEIERVWLQLKLGVITPAQKQQVLTDKFDQLKKHKPALYKWLTNNEHNLSMAERIRDKVNPPIHVGGYYTKQ